MLDSVLQTLWGPLGGILAGVGAFIAALLFGRSQRRTGAADQRAKDATETQKRVEAGRNAVRDGRGDTPDERLRRNDGWWN